MIAHTTSTNQGCGPLFSSAPETSRPLKQQFFECVRAAGAIARVDVAKQLDISPATVTSLSSELISDGLIHEIDGERDTGRGRPRVALGVVPEAHLVVGMKLSDREHTAVLSDFAGTVLASVAIDRDTPLASESALLDLVGDLLDAVCGQGNIDRKAVSALGIGISGFVDHKSGFVHWSPIFSERKLNLARLAAERFDIATSVDNDANLATLAELWFGAGRNSSDFAVVTIEHGVGMGLVINHQLYRGSRGFGTELGHTKVQMEGALCRCGQRGCLEAYLADYALAREATTALGLTMQASKDVPQLVEALYAKAVDGHPGARSIFKRAGNYLALGLANVANLFDPKRIILSGSRMKYDLLYAEDVLAEIERLALNSDLPPISIDIQRWGDLIWARGATALALSAVTEELLGAGYANTTETESAVA